MQFKYGRLFVRADIDLSAEHDFFVFNGFLSIDIFVSPSLHTILNCTPLFLSHVISNEIFRWFALSEIMNHSVHLSLKINFRILVRVEIRAISNTFKKRNRNNQKKDFNKIWNATFSRRLRVYAMKQNIRNLWWTFKIFLQCSFTLTADNMVFIFNWQSGQHWKVSHWQFFSFYVPLSLPHRINIDKFWQ